MTNEELLNAVNASSITTEELTSMLQLNKVQMEITIKQNQIAQIQVKAQTDAQTAQAQIQAIQQEMLALQQLIQGNVPAV